MSWAGVRWTTIDNALRKREPGLYELRQLLREHWPRVKNRGLYGAIVKHMVMGGSFPQLRCAGVKSNGNQVYEVLPKE